jgi:hypothetical protein
MMVYLVSSPKNPFVTPTPYICAPDRTFPMPVRWFVLGRKEKKNDKSSRVELLFLTPQRSVSHSFHSQTPSYPILSNIRGPRGVITFVSYTRSHFLRHQTTKTVGGCVDALPRAQGSCSPFFFIICGISITADFLHSVVASASSALDAASLCCCFSCTMQWQFAIAYAFAPC